MNRKSTRIKLMQTEYDVLQAQNVRLAEENTALRTKLDSLMNNAGSSAATHVEARIIAMKMEDERDNMFDNLERLKKRYNSLQDAYVEKVKRCKALEDTFARQKTLAGLVMRSAIDQRLNEQELARKHRETMNEKTSELRITKLKDDLDAAYDIIDELEFELESIDFLEMENQRLKNELRELKAQKADAQRRPSAASSDSSECSGGVDLVDAAVLESVTVTESNLIQTAEVESNCLRRELLRSRLKNTLKMRTPIIQPPPSPPPPGSLVRSPSENVLHFQLAAPRAVPLPVPVPLVRSPSAHTLKPPSSPQSPPELPRLPPPQMPLQRSPSASVQPQTPPSPQSPIPLLRSPSASTFRSYLPAPPVPPKPPRRSPSTTSTVAMDDSLIEI